MTKFETLTTFADLFVNKPFRERFVHEALKKPSRLHARICHKISDVFDAKYRNTSIPIDPNAECLLLGWASKLMETTWSAAVAQMGMGGGILVIDGSGRKFYAETEFERSIPAEVWAGEMS